MMAVLLKNPFVSVRMHTYVDVYWTAQAMRTALVYYKNIPLAPPSPSQEVLVAIHVVAVACPAHQRVYTHTSFFGNTFIICPNSIQFVGNYCSYLLYHALSIMHSCMVMYMYQQPDLLHKYTQVKLWPSTLISILLLHNVRYMYLFFMKIHQDKSTEQQ